MSEGLLGSKIGHFRVVELIGKGGMGEVYVGYDEKLERKVALKTIRAEFRLNAESKARFLREARVLSQLAHPGICQIFELVETEEADILVLELIQGRKLSQLISEKHDHRTKLALAIELAGALVAAHGKGIIHRDLKPDNVMVDDHGRVKVLDFGLARSLGDETVAWAESTAPEVLELSPDEGLTPHFPSVSPGGEWSDDFRTRFGSILGTVGYMSPEQAKGEPATSASDIYSLGIIFQELFSGEGAFLREGTFPEQLLRAMAGTSRPVTGLDPDLARLVEGMKSLAPAARPTAGETLGRLHWVLAKPARRRKRFLMAAALVVLAAFSIGSTIQAVLIARARNRANQAADRAQRMLAFLTGTFEVANPRKGKGPSATAKEIIDHASKKLDETKEQPLLQASLMATLSSIYVEMGLFDPAESLARGALEIRELTLGPNDLEVATSLSDLAAVSWRQGKLAEADSLSTRALEIRERTLGPNHPDVAKSLNGIATVRGDLGRLDEAESLQRRSVAIAERALGPDHPQVALYLNNLAIVCRYQDKLGEAERHYGRALEIREKALDPDHPDVALSLDNLAILYWRQGKLALAEPLFVRSLAIREKVLGLDHPDVARSLNNLANLRSSQERYAEAQSLLEQSLAIRERTLGPNHPDVAVSLNNLGNAATAQGKLGEAEALFRRSLQVTETTLGPDHPQVAIILENLANTYVSGAKYGEAEPLYRRILMIRETSLGPSHMDVGITLYNLGMIATNRDRRSEALEYMRRAIPLLAGTSYWEQTVEVGADIAPLRADPEFQRIVAEAQRQAGSPTAKPPSQ